MKILKIIYYIFLASIALIAILLIVSAFPVTGNIKFMVVQSGSMEPAIKMGSIVMARPSNDYKIGDVITFGSYSENKLLITHRIYDIKVTAGAISYITKGDANNSPDQMEISQRDIVGKVLFSVPYLGYAVDFAKKPLGFALIIIVPAMIIIFDEAKNIWQEIIKMRQKSK